MLTFKSALFGDIPSPSSLYELLDIAKNASPKGRSVYMWRGQSDILWPIHSGAYRRLALEQQPSEFDLSYYEKGLLDRATHRGYRFLDGRTLSDFELLARLQHHGAATRLLDATRSILVALYFACAENMSKTGVLLGWHNYFIGGYEEQTNNETYDEIIKGLAEHDHPQTWQPTEVSPRIAAQHSQFLYSRIADDPRGSVCIDPSPGSLLAVALRPEVKSDFIQTLSEQFDVRLSTIFPDIDGFGRANSVSIRKSENYRW